MKQNGRKLNISTIPELQPVYIWLQRNNLLEKIRTDLGFNSNRNIEDIIKLYKHSSFCEFGKEFPREYHWLYANKLVDEFKKRTGNNKISIDYCVKLYNGNWKEFTQNNIKEYTWLRNHKFLNEFKRLVGRTK